MSTENQELPSNIKAIIYDGMHKIDKLPTSTIAFEKTSSFANTGPTLIDHNLKNKRLFAVVDVFGFNRIYEFYTQEEANQIQLSVHNGQGTGVIWRYL